MEINKDELSKFISENRGKRKFKQSVELAINFRGVDFNKQDNRLNLEVMLPNGKGKVSKLAVFANERGLISTAERLNIEVIDGNRLESIATDQARLRQLTEYDLVAQPNLMPNIAKFLGQYLGPRNKMPRPLIGTTLEKVATDQSRRIVIRNKGKYLPTVHCVVGSEDLEPEKIQQNINEVLNAVTKKMGGGHIKSVFVKLSMSKPLKIV